MTIKKIHKRLVSYTLEHYTGSLDFPCNFCNSNSYDNYHIEVGQSLKVVVCQECLDKVREVK